VRWSVAQAGLIYLAFALRMASLLTKKPSTQLFVFLMLTFMGSVHLFFGYAEHYPWQYSGVLIYLFYALKFLHGEGRTLTPVTVFLVLLPLHFSPFSLFPFLPILLLFRERGQGLPELINWYYCRTGKLQQCEQELSKALHLKPDYQRAYVTLEETRMQRGDFQDARKCFTRAVRLGTEDPQVFNNLGILCVQFGDLEKAALFCRKAIAKKKDSPEPRYGLAHVHHQQ
jgi:tetratricopeptide (TPR) repeat protein